MHIFFDFYYKICLSLNCTGISKSTPTKCITTQLRFGIPHYVKLEPDFQTGSGQKIRLRPKNPAPALKNPAPALKNPFNKLILLGKPYAGIIFWRANLIAQLPSCFLGILGGRLGTAKKKNTHYWQYLPMKLLNTVCQQQEQKHCCLSRLYKYRQCCGSGMIYSRYGSSLEFSEFRIRIRAKVPDPCGSGSNLY